MALASVNCTNYHFKTANIKKFYSTFNADMLAITFISVSGCVSINLLQCIERVYKISIFVIFTT